MRDQIRELRRDELESIGGGGFGSVGASIGATGAGAAQIDFFALYCTFVCQPPPPLICGDGICA